MHAIFGVIEHLHLQQSLPSGRAFTCMFQISTLRSILY